MVEQNENHRKEFGEAPVLSIEVPQPTVLIGQFCDVIMAHSLICLTDQGISMTFSPRNDNVIRIVNSVRQDKKKFTYPNIKYRREDRWANAVKAVLHELSRRNRKIGGYNIFLSGRGAGADSWSLTSSLFVGTLLAMDELEGLGLGKDEIMDICLKANSFSPDHQARHRDLWILLNGKEGMVYLWSEQERKAEEMAFGDLGKSCYIVSSALPPSYLTPEEEEFRDMAKDVVTLMADHSVPISEIRTMTEKEARTMTSRFPDQERRCLTHLVVENECSTKAASSIIKGDRNSFGRVLFMLQRSVVENAELTSPELDWIWRRGQECDGVLGLGSIGVGIAGSFLAVVDGRASNLYARKEEEYERIFGFRSSIRPFVPLNSPRAVRC